MHAIDYGVVVVFLLGLLILGFCLSRRAGKNTEEYILGGRKMPWWLAGTSVAATGLNASTMLNDSRKIRQDGLSGLWFTWTNVVGSLVNAIWFTRLWRRARFTTQMEFYQSRYTGRPAVFARIYDSVLYGIIVAAIWASAGLVGMKKIIPVLLDLPTKFTFFGLVLSTDIVVVLVLVVITLIYSAAAGVYGVVWTDFVEFIITMVSSYVLLFLVYRDMGWNVGLRNHLLSLDGEGRRILSLVPTAIPILIYFLFIQPLFGLGNYGPATQRYLCLKNEREVLYTAFYNAFINFILKSWPFYICGLAGLILISDQFLASRFPMIAGPDGTMIADYERVIPTLVQMYLPVGAVGLMMSGFLSAFMSSFDTNIHNSTAIAINDIYRPYILTGRSERHYVQASRIYMVAITVLASLIGILSHDILKLTMFGIAVSLSPGMVKLLRFVWWRVNGITEVITQWIALGAAIFMISPVGGRMINSILETLGLSGNDPFHAVRLLLLVGVTTSVSLILIFLTKPEPIPHLCEFYKRVRPFGFWRPVREACGSSAGRPDSMRTMAALSACSVISLFSGIFMIVGLFFAFWVLFAGAFSVFLPAVFGTALTMKRLYPEK